MDHRGQCRHGSLGKSKKNLPGHSPRLFYIMPGGFKIKSDPKGFIKELKKVHGQMEKVAVNVLNHAAKLILNEYKRKNKKDYVIRGKFTENAVRMFKATTRGRGGSLRPIKNINAVVFVPTLKGGGEHYLAKHEFGKSVTGAKSTKGFIATPTDAARVGKKYKGRISRAGDLRKIGKIQNLTVKGRRVEDLFKGKQLWAVLYKYAKSGENPYGWDLKKSFFLFGNVHVFKRNRFPRIRTLEDKIRKLPKNPNFTESVEKVGTPQKMEQIFKREAHKVIR